MHTRLTQYLSGLALALATLSAQALPTLQLDIIGGTYDNGSESIVTSNDAFSLVAYGGGANISNFYVDGDYFISIALTPKAGSQSGPIDFGSFVFGGITYDMDDVVFGTPPIENTAFYQPSDPHDLSDHQVFPTLYAEYKFNFDENQTSAAVNTQDVTGSNPLSNPGSALYYMLFNVDISNLMNGYGLHFDLYNTVVQSNTECTGKKNNRVCTTQYDIDRDDFAPYSHDASSSEDRQVEVPEPAPLMLLALGMLALALTARRKSRQVN